MWNRSSAAQSKIPKEAKNNKELENTHQLGSNQKKSHGRSLYEYVFMCVNPARCDATLAEAAKTWNKSRGSDTMGKS